jgi:hypothetical protein
MVADDKTVFKSPPVICGEGYILLVMDSEVCLKQVSFSSGYSEVKTLRIERNSRNHNLQLNIKGKYLPAFN